MSASPKTAPGPYGHVLVGKLWHIRQDKLGFVTQMTSEFGDVVRFRMGIQVLHLINRPDYIRYVLQDNQKNYRKGVGLAQAKRWLGEGLVTSEGEVWSRQRRLIQPAFQRQHVSEFASAVADSTRQMLEQWSDCVKQKQSVDVASQMMRLTLGIITRLMFSTDITNASDIGSAFTTALQATMNRMTAIVAWPDWFPSPANLRLKRAVKILETTVETIIQMHRGEASNGKNLLSILLSEYKDTQDGFRNKELRDQVMTILLAGHETTASSLAWTFYLLSRHRWAWELMRHEIDRVLGGRIPTYDDLSQLSWTRMVYEESLRIYPPVWLIPRKAINADEVGGYHIPSQSHVLISPYAMHRHPGYWNQPEAFNPERFSKEESSKRHQHAYLPFGAGPRVCIGSSLAMMEALMILTMVTQQYRLQIVPGFAVVPEPLLTLRFRHGLAMTPVKL